MRSVVSWILLVLAVLICVVAALGAWADRELLDTDQFTQSSVEVLQDPAVQQATAAFLSDQLLNGAELNTQLKDALPDRLDGLAGPLAATTSELAERTALRVIQSGAFQTLWEKTTRLAHSQLLAVIEDDDGLLAQKGVVLDLRPQLGVLAQRMGITATPTGDKSVITVIKGDQLDSVRQAVDIFHKLRWITAALAALLIIAAVWVAPDRRRGLANAGAVLVFTGLLLLIARRVGGREVVTALTDNGAASDATAAMWQIMTRLLSSIAGAGIVLGVGCLIGAWLAGASRWATKARHALAPGLVDHPELGYGAVLLLLITLLAAGLLPAASRPIAIVVYVVLAVAGVTVLRRQVVREQGEMALPSA